VRNWYSAAQVPHLFPPPLTCLPSLAIIRLSGEQREGDERRSRAALAKKSWPFGTPRAARVDAAGPGLWRGVGGEIRSAKGEEERVETGRRPHGRARLRLSPSAQTSTSDRSGLSAWRHPPVLCGTVPYPPRITGSFPIGPQVQNVSETSFGYWPASVSSIRCDSEGLHFRHFSVKCLHEEHWGGRY
jgi:hypothetical protein